tara:strand:+ start:319 stop:615 length:297 start_codon:yes stop_codon:yes gene_type:complete
MGKYKKNKPKREKKGIVYRTKEERQEEIKKIIATLSELELGIIYDPIKELYKIMKEYVEKGIRTEINIPFPEIKRRIKGILAISIREQCRIKMQIEKY